MCLNSRVVSETPKNFLEEGLGSEVLALSDRAGVPLAETQKEMTPLQRMVILKELERQQDESQSGGMPAKNSHPGAGRSVQGNTTTYVNDGA